MEPLDFNGPTEKERLRWLWSVDGLECFPPGDKNYRLYNKEGNVGIQGHGVTIFLTENGWYLEDSSGG
jgi:hypothetical protein